MSRNQRLAVVLIAVVIAVVGFTVASPGGDDEPDEPAQTTGDTPGDTVDATLTPDDVEPAKPAMERITIRGGEVVGGPRRITATKGERVRIVVAADTADDIHLHGYDIERQAAPGSPARFDFRATIEGEFEIESHVAEDAGREPLVATLVVEPA